MNGTNYFNIKMDTVGFPEVDSKSRLKEQLENINKKFDDFEKTINRLEWTNEALNPNSLNDSTILSKYMRCLDLNVSAYNRHMSTIRRLCGSINQIKLKIKSILLYIKENKNPP